MAQQPYYYNFPPSEEKRITDIFRRHGISTAFTTRYPEGKVTHAPAETSINIEIEPQQLEALKQEGIRPTPGKRLGRTCWYTPVEPKAG